LTHHAVDEKMETIMQYRTVAYRTVGLPSTVGLFSLYAIRSNSVYNSVVSFFSYYLSIFSIILFWFHVIIENKNSTVYLTHWLV